MAGFFDFLKDPGGYTRYGMSTNEKGVKALQGLPGAPIPPERISDPEAEAVAQRDAAGYLFGKNWGKYPWLARAAQYYIADPLHTGDPRQRFADSGLERGIRDYEKENPYKAPETTGEGIADMLGWRGELNELPPEGEGAITSAVRRRGAY